MQKISKEENISILYKALKSAIKNNYLIILIIFIFAVVHLPGITTPPIDEHNWRQTDTASVARNFQYESANIFMPRVDIRGQFTGITGMELPVYNYSLFIFNAVFDYQHWHGRLLTLIFGCIGLAYFYGLIKRRYSKSLALFSATVLAFMPLYFLFSKNIQPDILMLTIMLVSIYYAQRYSEKYQDKYFYLSLLLLSLTTLIKIPGLFAVIPIILIVGKQGIINIFKPKKIIYILLILVLPVVAWYAWSDHLSKTYGMGNYFYGDLSLAKSLSLALNKSFWRTIADYIIPLPYVAVYLLAFIGLIISIAKKNFLPIVWFMAFATFLGLFAIKSYYHNYYALPIVPPLALMVGIALEWIYLAIKKYNKAVAVLFVVCLLASLGIFIVKNVGLLYSNKVSVRYPELGLIIDKCTTKDDLIIVNGNVNPAMLYFSNRKGWSLKPSMINEPEINNYRSIGAKFLLLDRAYIAEPQIKNIRAVYTTCYEDSSFVIFKI